jgi:Rrf2 family protein
MTKRQWRARLDSRERSALITIAEIAKQSVDRHASLHAIAFATNVSLSSVEKYATAFRKEGLIKSHRGCNGGYVLARPAREITVSDIISALDAWIAKSETFEGELSATYAEVDSLLAKSEQFLYGVLRAVTLDDILGARIESHPTFKSRMEELQAA